MLTNRIYLLIHFATTGMYDYIKQHENNNKNQSKIKRERERERERERMLLCAASNYLSLSFHGKTAGLGNEVLDSFKY